MSFGDPNPNPNNPYGQPQQPGGYPQQAPQGVPQQPGYGYPQAPPVQGYPQAPGYGGQPPQFGGWWRRVGGTIIDGLISGIPYGVLVGIGGSIGGGAGSALVIVGLLVAIAIFLWQLYNEGTNGQTIGKKAVGISLRRESDGQPIGFGMAFVRKIAHFVDSIACYLGWLW